MSSLRGYQERQGFHLEQRKNGQSCIYHSIYGMRNPGLTFSRRRAGLTFKEKVIYNDPCKLSIFLVLQCPWAVLWSWSKLRIGSGLARKDRFSPSVGMSRRLCDQLARNS